MPVNRVRELVNKLIATGESDCVETLNDPEHAENVAGGVDDVADAYSLSVGLVYLAEGERKKAPAKKKSK